MLPGGVRIIICFIIPNNGIKIDMTKESKIILYGDQYSYFTEQAREWLKSRGLDYEERNVSDKKNSDALYAVSGQYAIPVIVVGKKVVLGFNEAALNEIFK